MQIGEHRDTQGSFARPVQGQFMFGHGETGWFEPERPEGQGGDDTSDDSSRRPSPRSSTHGRKSVLGVTRGHWLDAESSSMWLRRNGTCAAMDEQLAYVRRQRGSDIITQFPEALSSHLEKASRNEQHEEGSRVRSSKACDTTRDQDVRSKSARSRKVRTAGHRGAWEKGTRQACGEGRALGCMPGVRVERHVDRQGQRDFRGLGPIKIVRGKEERDPGEGTAGCESAAPADVYNFDERARSSTDLRLGLVRLTRRSRPLATEFDRFAWDKFTNRGIELIKKWMAQHES